MAQKHISSIMNQYQKDEAAESNFTELYSRLPATFIADASVAGSTLTLTKSDGTTVTFTDTKVTSINGLSGGSLTSPLVIKGGDGAGAAKIALDHTQSGQITDESTKTLFGFTTNGTTTLTIGHSSYAMALRGSGTRPTYNGSNLALYSDIPSVPTVNNGTLTIQKNGTSVGTFTANQSGNTTANVVVNNGTLTIQQNGVQITTFGADQSGNATANIVTCNPNLLTNSNFAINQRGSTSYSGNNKYSVDRWKINGGNCVVTPQSNGTLKVHTTSTWNGINQFLNDYNYLKGKTITLTVSGTFASSGVRISIMQRTGSTSSDLAYIDGTSTDTSISVSFAIPSNASYDYLFVSFYNKSSGDSYLNYAKLEIGSNPTQYSPPLYEEEISKCYIYFRKIMNLDSQSYTAFAYLFGDGSGARAILPYTFRAKPTIISSNGSFILQTNSGSYVTINSFQLQSYNTDSIVLKCNTSSTISGGLFAYFQSNNSIGAYITIDAEIY